MPDNGTTTDERFAKLVRRIDPDARLVRAWKPTGGVSAEVTALEIEQADGRRNKLIVRQHGEVDLAQNPRVAADEFRLLQILHTEDLPTPIPYYVDESGEIFGTPCIVIEFIEGSADFTTVQPDVLVPEMATQLARIHGIDSDTWDLSFLPDQVQRCASRLARLPANLDDALDERHIRELLVAVWPLTQRNRSVLLHGDFWPGNTLWLESTLTGIIDWEDAGVGDPLADLANTRMELMLMFGADAMHQFTQRYLALVPIDVSDLPYWELCAAVRPITGMPGWELDDATLSNMRANLRAFITQALAAIAPS